MSGIIKRLYDNLRYLFKCDLKEMNKAILDLDYMFDNIKYEISSDLENIKKVKILNADDSLDVLCNSDKSIARFGDGEIRLIFGTGVHFQKYDEKLSQKLKTTLVSSFDNLFIGLPDFYASLMDANMVVKNAVRRFYGKYTPLILPMLNEKQVYAYSAFTFPYINVGFNNNKEYYETRYNKFRRIWDNKDIVIVSGDKVFDKIKYNIYDNAKSIEYIKAPSINAFSKYDELLSEIKTKEKSKLIILILGPTATAMAHDLAQLGYRALDLGHLGKDYDAFKKGVISNKENIGKFFSPD